MTFSVFDFVIFGGTGDLTKRKLLPALFRQFRANRIDSNSHIYLVSSTRLSRPKLNQFVLSALEAEVDGCDGDRTGKRHFLARVSHCCINLDESSSWKHLTSKLGNHTCVYYLATLPRFYESVVQQLSRNGLLASNCRLVIEKPIGSDLPSAKKINDQICSVLNEEQVYRVDHYLGKETVQNLLALRFGNTLFEPLWRHQWIDHVQITIAEEVGIDERWQFYESTGALKDMVQNHLLQLLCLVAMEPPASMAHEDIRNEKVKILRALRSIGASDAEQLTVRGRYAMDDTSCRPGKMPGQASEDVAKGGAETFVAIKVEIDNWRWSGTPFYLRTGKRMAAKSSEIVICFKALNHSIFPATAGTIESNKLIIRLQPNEGVTLGIMAKTPGIDDFRLCSIPLDLSFFETFGGGSSDAYERLIVEILRGDPTLFLRADEVTAAWRWIDQINESWAKLGQKPSAYPPGSWGPEGAATLMQRDKREWHNATYE